MTKITLVLVLVVLCSSSRAQENSSKDLYAIRSFKDALYKKIKIETKHGNIAVSLVDTVTQRLKYMSGRGVMKKS